MSCRSNHVYFLRWGIAIDLRSAPGLPTTWSWGWEIHWIPCPPPWPPYCCLPTSDFSKSELSRDPYMRVPYNNCLFCNSPFVSLSPLDLEAKKSSHLLSVVVLGSLKVVLTSIQHKVTRENAVNILNQLWKLHNFLHKTHHKPKLVRIESPDWALSIGTILGFWSVLSRKL